MRKKLVVFLSICVLLLASFAGCSGSYSRRAIGGGPSASDPVSNNGSMVVTKGDYYYYINGKADQNADNTYDKVVKGAIMRTLKGDLYDASKHEIIVPKVALNSYAQTGFYIFGDKIYFTSPNADKDKSGEVQSTYLDFMWSTLDGSKCERLMIKDSASIQHKYYENGGKVYLAYVDSTKGTLSVMDCATQTVKDIVKEFSAAPTFLSNGKAIYTANVYYDLVTGKETPDVDKEKYTENQDKYGVAKYNQAIIIDLVTGEKTTLKKDTDAEVKYNYAFTKQENVLGTEYIYFTKSEIAGGTSKAGTYRTTVADFSIDNAVMVSTSTSLGTFLTAPNGNGYITQGTTAIMWNKKVFDANGAITTNIEKPIYKVAGTTLFDIRKAGDNYYLYYLNSGALERIDLPGDNIVDGSLVDNDDVEHIVVLGKAPLDTMGTDWLKPMYLDGKWFFFNSGSDAFNKIVGADDEDKEIPEDDKSIYKHVEMYKRSGYLFTAIEVDGEDYEDKIVPPVRVGKLSDVDKEAEEDKIEEENIARDKSKVSKFDEDAKKIFQIFGKVEDLSKDKLTDEMRDLVTRFNKYTAEEKEYSGFKQRMAKLEARIAELDKA